MKKLILMLTVLFVFVFIKTKAQEEPVIDFNYFYTSLLPYGEWIELSPDLIVWHPNDISPRWRPYTLGHWNWTDQGWFWDSDEEFGWATYHYGRWYKDVNYGWIWVPGYDWAPSWVEWRHDNNYIGWAPLPPYASYNEDNGINFSVDWHSTYDNWNFVSYNRFNEPRLSPFLLMGPGVERIFDHTTYSNNYYSDHGRIVNGGVDRSFLELKIGFRLIAKIIAPVESIHDYSSRERRGDRIVIYRPPVREIEKSRSITKFDFRKGESSTSLIHDKIRTSERREMHSNESRQNPSERFTGKNEQEGKRFEKKQPEVKQQENNPAVIQNNNHGSNQQGNILFGNQSKTGTNQNQQTSGTQPTTGKQQKNGRQTMTETQPTAGTQPKTGIQTTTGAQSNMGMQQKNGKQTITTTQPTTGKQPKTGKQPAAGTVKTPNKNGAQPAKEEEKKKQQ